MQKLTFFLFLLLSTTLAGQDTRLLRSPTVSGDQLAFTHGGDLWITTTQGGKAIRLTSTPAVESNPHFSPDGKLIAFTSNRSGTDAIYTIPVAGGEPKRLTWHPAAAKVRGWTNDGKHILYASDRATAPSRYDRLWTISLAGGPATMLAEQWATDGSYSANGQQMVIDRVRRWDVEWRAYRGGQNTPLTILDLKTLEETSIPNQQTTDIKPLWQNGTIYFLSDRDYTTNVWAYEVKSKSLKQVTKLQGTDIKNLAGDGKTLVIEREGYLHVLDPTTGKTKQLSINVIGDFPWAETRWEDVSQRAGSAALSPNGKRALMEARGEIFTIPVEHGNARNLTQSSGAADRAPIWSPKGDQIAWFSDQGQQGYSLLFTGQSGLGETTSISIGESKMAWEPTWSPDGKYIAFTDDDVRIRIVNLAAKTIKTIDNGGNNLERGNLGLSWSFDSQWLAYAKSGNNNFRQVNVWSVADGSIKTMTDPLADSFSPAWDRNQKHLYFLASTDVALGSSWANTSSMTSNPEYAAYVINLNNEDKSPFVLRSDEEDVEEEKEEDLNVAESEKEAKQSEEADDESKEKPAKEEPKTEIDFERLERRTIPLPMPERNYAYITAGPEGSAFIAERVDNERGLSIHKFTLEDREAKPFLSGAGGITISANGKKMLTRVRGSWKMIDTNGKSGEKGESLHVSLRMKLDRQEEWKQLFEEAWRYERDYFYDPGMHGRNWEVVHDRYAPLIPHVKHRADLTYILDQVNGELSVGHSFVFGGDYPDTDNQTVGLLGADLTANNGRWQIKRIFTTESWNPGLTSPLDEPGMDVKEGYYLVGVNGREFTATDNPFEFLDGTLGQQTVLHLNQNAEFDGNNQVIVQPIRNENALRQRAWVEDNRRKVDELSDGKLAYVWVPNTAGAGFVSFNRYYFGQQDKQGAVIDERFNGGGFLDDYMVDLLQRDLRAALTNEVPNGQPLRLPAGIHGPKVLLINEMAGSGGDFFPWAFRQQQIGPLIGTTTWGGLVKSSVHYGLIDGGALTAPDNAVFDPINGKWVAENYGVAPDITVRQDAKSLQEGRDPQLERAVQETLKLLKAQGERKVKVPAFPRPVREN